MWVKCMYNWVVNGILASLNNKELLIFDSGYDSLYIESTNWLLCWKKKRLMCFLKMKDTGFLEKCRDSWIESQAEFDLVYQPSQRWKVAPIQPRLSKERTSLIFLFLWLCVITGFTFHFVSLSSVTICHNCFLFVYRVFFEVLKHSIVQKWNGTCCKLAIT